MFRKPNEEVANMKRNLLLVIFLVLSLVLCACSSKKENTAASYDTGAVSSDGGASSYSKTESDHGVAKTDTATAPTKEYKGSADTAIPDSPAAADYDGGSDMLMSESYSLRESATSDLIATESFDMKYSTEVKDGAYDDVIGGETPVIIEEPPVKPQLKAGTLTAGEWNDNKNFDFLKGLITDGQNYRYSDFFTKWDLSPFSRLVICCRCEEAPVQNAKVTVYDTNGNVIWTGVTDYEGMVYAYYALTDASSNPIPSVIKAEYNGSVKEQSVMKDDLRDNFVAYVDFDSIQPIAKTLDLMFTVDTTGSMGDEIYYLQEELQDVIKRVQNDTANIPVRLSVNFYRDMGDEYVVRPYEFSTNINEQLTYLNKEYASGGGDFEEAVEKALANSVNEHAWDENSIKLMFLVLDAPPHNTAENRQILLETITKASEMGIRIIPVASSGIDKDTEFLLRAFAMSTGGTYTFLTDDSGVGGSHLEPTVGEYEVEQLNDLLVRLIEKYIG